MSAFQAEYLNGVLVHRFANDAGFGSAIVSAVRRLDGREVGGQTYVITFTGVTPGGAATAHITASYGGNAQNTRTVAVVLDGVTVHTDLVRGWDIVLSASGSFTSAWRSTIYDGIDIGVADPGNPTGRIVDFLAGPPTVLTGQPAGSVNARGKLNWRNVSGQLATGSKSRLLTPYAYKPTAGAGLLVFDIVGNLTPKLGVAPARQILPYAITFANLNTAPTPDIIDMLIDGVSAANTDTTDGTVATSLQSKRDGTTLYLITAGPLANGRYTVAATAVNSDAGELRVWPQQFQKQRPQTGGSFVTTDIDLTGQTTSTTGNIPDNDYGQAEYQYIVPSGAAYAQSPVQMSIFLQAALTIPSGA